MVRILLRAGRCPKAAGDPSRLRSEVQILWGYRDQWATITHVNSWSMYFVLVRWSILEFGMMLHADQWGFTGSLVDVCGCRIGNSHREVFHASGGWWRMDQFTHLQHIVLHAFWHLVLSESLAALSKIDSLLQCYYKSWMELVRFYGQTVECVFNIIHIGRVFVDIFHGTFRVPAPMQVALCAPPVNLERVSGQMSEPAISHQSCTSSGFAVIELMYTTHDYIYTYLHCIILKWWLADQNSEVKHVDVQSVLVYLFFATCTHLNWLIQNISFSRCCRFRGRVSNLLGSILGSEARHPSFPPTHPVSYASRRWG